MDANRPDPLIPDTGRPADLTGEIPTPGGVDLLADAVFCVDARDKAIAEVNQAACAALGYTREELLGMSLGRICSPEELADLTRQFAEAAAGPRATVLLRVEQRRKDGVAVPTEWHVFENCGPAGRVLDCCRPRPFDRRPRRRLWGSVCVVFRSRRARSRSVDGIGGPAVV